MSELTHSALGWGAHFQSQLSLDEIETARTVRVAAVHRSAYDVLAAGAGEIERMAAPPHLPSGAVAVGDWLVIGPDGRPARLLERKTLLQRAVSAGREAQPIAANVDTLFVVTSCNADFNRGRIERYLALAHASGCLAVLVLTKADLAEDLERFGDAARDVARDVPVELLNALDPEQVSRLAPWCGPGQTVALAGMSGVGKSTLVNSLAGTTLATAGIREDDARGRHTTTARALYRLPAGGWLVDTPGMRALGLHDAAEGVDAVFEDIAALAATCRFADCGHESEPGCAVQAAIAAGEVDPGRLARWQKLAREDRRNSATLAEQRSRERAQSKMYRRIASGKQARRDGAG